MNAEHLYKEEQRLLKELIKSKSKERQDAARRTIIRLNKELETLDG